MMKLSASASPKWVSRSISDIDSASSEMHAKRGAADRAYYEGNLQEKLQIGPENFIGISDGDYFLKLNII